MHSAAEPDWAGLSRWRSGGSPVFCRTRKNDRMPRPLAPPLSAALKTLRTARGWTERELADAAGTTRKLVSAYETGKEKTLSREKLDGLVAVMGGDAADVDLALLLLGALAPAAEGIAFVPTAPSAPEVHRASRMAARVGLTAAHLTRTRLLGLARARRRPGGAPRRPPSRGRVGGAGRARGGGGGGGAGPPASGSCCGVRRR